MPVFVTPLMIIRCFETSTFTIHHHWVPMEEMSKHLPVAVMASEDQCFLLHNGFDYKAIRQAAVHNIKGGKVRGASTISQQTAKNVFLWQDRTWLRKGLEMYFTVLIELFWSKHRIMEVYLNSIEMGENIYGADAVALRHFGKTAKELNRSECALIAGSLPNPRKFNSKSPGSYLIRRQRQIMAQMKTIPSFPKEGEEYDPHTTTGGIYHRGK